MFSSVNLKTVQFSHLINSMEQKLNWKAYGYWTSQEMSHILWNLKVIAMFTASHH